MIEKSYTTQSVMSAAGVNNGKSKLLALYIHGSSSSGLNAEFRILPPAGMGDICVHGIWLLAVVSPECSRATLFFALTQVMRGDTTICFPHC